jgi:RNA polymerase sigma-70 factor (ECF subfamily)
VSASSSGPERPVEGGSAEGLSDPVPSRVNAREEAARLTDEAALVEAARHDRTAFGVLYDRHFDAVYHYIASRVEDDAVAEDLAAATWERALRAIERYEIRGLPFMAWMYRIAGNLVANHHRHRRLLQMVGLTERESAGDPRSGLEERTAVRSAFQALSESDQEILALYYFAEMGAADIAGVLGCSDVAVHKRLHRARERLRSALEGGGRVATSDA